jgi:hypothetical protein
MQRWQLKLALPCALMHSLITLCFSVPYLPLASWQASYR